MLFTITKEQYQECGNAADICRQYIIDHYPKLCETINIFNGYFGPDKVDVCSTYFNEKSLLLMLLEDYKQHLESGDDLVLDDFLEIKFNHASMLNEGVFAGLAIYVHWPEVTVTNERGQSVLVKDLYAKIDIFPSGRLYQNFTLSRATYSYEQYTSDYMHSHAPGISRDPSIFLSPCLGSGPLIRTQQTLKERNRTEMWDLFCVELDRYVQVESIAGTPYRHLNKIGSRGMSTYSTYADIRQLFTVILTNPAYKYLFSRFYRYALMHKKLKFSFSNGRYMSAYSKIEFVIKLSKLFLRFYAMMHSARKTDVTLTDLLGNKLLVEVKRRNNNLCCVGDANSLRPDYRAFQDKHVLYFKGQDIRTHINEPTGTNENTSYVLNYALVEPFLEQCLNYLNIYEHEKQRNIIKEINQEDEVCSGSGSNRSKNTFTDYPIGEKRVMLNL